MCTHDCVFLLWLLNPGRLQENLNAPGADKHLERMLLKRGNKDKGLLDCLLRKCLVLCRNIQEKLHLRSLISSKKEIDRISVQKHWFLCYMSGNKFSQGWCGLTRVCVAGNISRVAEGGVGYAHADCKGCTLGLASYFFQYLERSWGLQVHKNILCMCNLSF